MTREAPMTTSFANPVIAGFHPDPSACRVGDEYFLATSTFTYAPGVAIFRSANLVDWTQIGNALDRPSLLDFAGTETYDSLGIFAPTLRHHDGRFWMITTMYGLRGPDNFFVTADDAAGPWSEPVHVAIRGIDPDLAWDVDGTCWVHYSNGKGICRVAINDTTGAVLGEPEPTWSGTGLQFPEAPHLFERAGTWYLVIAEGGTERGHAVSVARGPSPTGPWEGCPANPILSNRSTDRPIQNTGHADLIEAADGSWWMVLLGTRPRGGTPMFHVLGRETFLTPVEWTDGWPVAAPVALDVDRRPPGPCAPPPAPQRTDFDDEALDPRWLAVRQLPAAITCLERRPGWLTVRGTDQDLSSPTPSFVGVRQQHERCQVRALLDPGDASEAGLCVRMDERSHYEIAVCGERIVATARVGQLVFPPVEVPRPDRQVVLLARTTDGAGGPDVVELGYEDHTGEQHVLAQIDGRFLSTEVAGGMLGRVIGMYSRGGDAAFDWFEHTDLDSAPSRG